MIKTWYKLTKENLKKGDNLMLHSIVFLLSRSFLPLVSSYLIRETIIVFSEGNMYLILKIVVLFFVILTSLNSVNIFSYSKVDTILTSNRFKALNKLNEVLFRIDYLRVEDEEFINSNYKALSSLNSSDVGYEKVSSILLLLPGDLLAIGYISIILAYLNLNVAMALILYFFIALLINIKLSIKKDMLDRTNSILKSKEKARTLLYNKWGKRIQQR